MMENAMSMDADALMRTLYDELRKMARCRLRPGQTLQPTELVHEVYLKLKSKRNRGWKSRSHFKAIAAHAMRDVMVDYLRRRKAKRRGGGLIRVELEATLVAGDKSISEEDYLWLHRKLDELQTQKTIHAEVIILRFFAGFTMKEVAEQLSVPKIRVERAWAFARTWMTRDGRSESLLPA